MCEGNNDDHHHDRLNVISCYFIYYNNFSRLQLLQFEVHEKQKKNNIGNKIRTMKCWQERNANGKKGKATDKRTTLFTEVSIGFS